MKTVKIENFVSATSVSKAFGKFLAKSKETPVFILKNNRVEGVLLNIDQYNELVEVYELAQDRELARKIFEQPTVNPEDKDAFEIMREIELSDQN